MSAVVVRREPIAAAEWDAFVRRQHGWTHFHLAGWREVIGEVFGHECLPLAARDAGGAIVGVLPLVRVRSLVFGHYLMSMPFLNYGGPLGTEAGVRALAAEAVVLADAARVKLLELRARVALPLDLPVSHRKVTVLLDLADTPDAQFKRFEAKLRSQVRKPQKEGVTVRFGHDQVEPFFRVFARHMRDLGTPTLPRTFFAAIARAFPAEDAWFACAYKDDEPIAAGAAFRYGDEVEITWASALREHSRLAPNMLLYWSMMERAIAAGVRVWNFGRCTPGGGTHRFKRQWTGARDEPLWWYGHTPRATAGELATTPSADGSALAWGPRVWRHLPERVATAMGPRIVRYLP